MSKIIKSLFLSVFIGTQIYTSDFDFGYISYYGGNIGNEIQSIAVKRLLPLDAINVNYDNLNTFSSIKPVKLVLNGWYQYGHRNVTYFPTSDCINPFFAS